MIEWACAQRSHGAGAPSGDRVYVRQAAGRALIAVIDGLGHGAPAAEAALAAEAELNRQPLDRELPDVLRAVHLALRRTRGAVMTLAYLRDESLRWTGVGNVEGRVVRAGGGWRASAEAVTLYGGVLGDRLPSVRVSTLPFGRGDLLLLATDGIKPGFAEGIVTGAPLQALADRLLADHVRGGDDALVVAARLR